MKTRAIRVFACGLAAAGLLCLAACEKGSGSSATYGYRGESQTDAGRTTTKGETGPSTEEQPIVMTEDGKFQSVLDYVRSDVMQERLTQLRTAQGSDTLSIDMGADGDRLIYSFTYKNLDGEDVDGLALALGSILEGTAMSNSYSQLAASLTEAVAVENPSVLVQYLTPDGQLITSKEYTAPAAEE